MNVSDDFKYYVELGKRWLMKHFPGLVKEDELCHHGVKGQKWGVRNGPPYPLERNDKSNIVEDDEINTNKVTLNIGEKKFTHYALDSQKSPDKAKAFKDALGYTKDNYKDLIENIRDNFDESKLVERGDDGYGMRY